MTNDELKKLVTKVLEDGHHWYVLEPTTIELIHSESFGYERQSIKL